MDSTLSITWGPHENNPAFQQEWISKIKDIYSIFNKPHTWREPIDITSLNIPLIFEGRTQHHFINCSVARYTRKEDKKEIGISQYALDQNIGEYALLHELCHAYDDAKGILGEYQSLENILSEIHAHTQVMEYMIQKDAPYALIQEEQQMLGQYEQRILELTQ